MEFSFFLSSQFSFSQIEKDSVIHLNWETSFKKAVKKSKKEKKPILLLYCISV